MGGGRGSDEREKGDWPVLQWFAIRFVPAKRRQNGNACVSPRVAYVFLSPRRLGIWDLRITRFLTRPARDSFVCTFVSSKGSTSDKNILIVHQCSVCYAKL